MIVISLDSNFRFERIEKKFRLNIEQYRMLLLVFADGFDRDEYDETLIWNVYYDTRDHYLIRKSIERPLFKEKIRIRSYGIPSENDLVFVEIKRKLNGVVYKRRIKVSFDKAKALLEGKEIVCDDMQVAKEIMAFVRRYKLEPSVCLSYRRYALVAKDDPMFRITIDQNLRYRVDDVVRADDEGMESFVDDRFILMEIKALGAIPLWFVKELSRLNVYQAPFSKIGACYTKYIAPLGLKGE